ncbi:NAD-dependent epimerase/dehydratase family protein [Streptomyces sp. CB03238]|uniref:NAD-dependent epimerase/dehydratase family protein n=1 Tax=Streptomyces sp. CB03238 TaxID=1907777 RepID=UPI001F4DC795|nr:NAD-dependent epimerase/dehydratase family protein [Streptomyces sp. CB03238]
MQDRHALLAGLGGRTVLVTGGAGLIGHRIVARLRVLGARPVALCKLDAYPEHIYQNVFGLDPHDPDVVAGDVQNAGLVRQLVQRSDYVIHAAALADVAACTRLPMAAIHNNITGTQTVLDAVAAAEGVQRLVFVSSASVYGNGGPEDWASPDDEHRTTRELLQTVFDGRTPPQFHERRELRPMSVYGNTKAFGERQTELVLGAIGTPYTIVRYFSVYGEPQVVKPHSHSWVVAWFSARAEVGLPLHLNGGGRQVRDLVHVNDIAEGTIRALVAPPTDSATVNIGTGTPTSIRQVATLVARHHDKTKFLDTPMPPGDPLGGYASTRHMEEVLGWKPGITIAEGVARYVAWLRRTPAAIPDWLREQSRAGT